MHTFWNKKRKKNESHDTLIKDRIVRDIRTLFERLL